MNSWAPLWAVGTGSQLLQRRSLQLLITGREFYFIIFIMLAQYIVFFILNTGSKTSSSKMKRSMHAMLWPRFTLWSCVVFCWPAESALGMSQQPIFQCKGTANIWKTWNSDRGSPMCNMLSDTWSKVRLVKEKQCVFWVSRAHEERTVVHVRLLLLYSMN